MKIMHLLPALSSGGVEQVVLELCEGLSSYGVECLVVSAGGRMVPQIEKTGARHFTHPLEKKRLRLLAEVFSLAKLFRAEQPDIVHVHSRIPGWVAYLAEKILPRTQRPVIVSSFHGVYSVNQYSRIMTRGAAVIAVSRFIRQHILTNYPATDPSLIHVIPNSIDTSSYYLGYRPDAKWIESWKRAFPELEGKFVLCLPARITFWKGQEMIAPIIRNLRDRGIPAHALIVGETKRGKERYRHKLEKLYADAGIDQHVSWLGHRNDLRDIMCILPKLSPSPSIQKVLVKPLLRPWLWGVRWPVLIMAALESNLKNICQKVASAWVMRLQWPICWHSGTEHPVSRSNL